MLWTRCLDVENSKVEEIYSFLLGPRQILVTPTDRVSLRFQSSLVACQLASVIGSRTKAREDTVILRYCVFVIGIKPHSALNCCPDWSSNKRSWEACKVRLRAANDSGLEMVKMWSPGKPPRSLSRCGVATRWGAYWSINLTFCVRAPIGSKIAAEALLFHAILILIIDQCKNWLE